MVKLGLSLSTLAFLMVSMFQSIPLIFKSVAYDLTCFMKVFSFGYTLSTFVYNSVFNGTMSQGVKIRVESSDSQVCSS